MASGHRYGFRVRAVDRSGRVGSWSSGSPTRSAIVGDGSAAVTYRGGWRSAGFATYLGGKVHYTRAAGATSILRFSGGSVAVIGPMGPGRGRAALYLDGTYVGAIDQRAARFAARRVLFVRNVGSGAHTLVVRSLGTAGRPQVAIDAFQILGPA